MARSPRKRDATNKREIAEYSLSVLNEALFALSEAVSDDISVRDLNSIAQTCSKIYRDTMNDITAEEKKNEEEGVVEVSKISDQVNENESLKYLELIEKLK